jgi:hypothetical protein
MGNRAVVAVRGKTADKDRAVYLHWNGGRASIQAFLYACADIMPCDNIERMPVKALKQFERVAREYIGGSVYWETWAEADRDNGDNGVYIIGADWRIVGREHVPTNEEIDSKKTDEIHAACIAAFPAPVRR